jgi:signal transduction histidine kinase
VNRNIENVPPTKLPLIKKYAARILTSLRAVLRPIFIVLLACLHLPADASVAGAAQPATVAQPIVVHITEAYFLQVPDLVPPSSTAPGWKRVNLPDSWIKQSRPRDVIGWYRLPFTLDASFEKTPFPISMYIPRATNNIAIFIGDKLLGVSGDIAKQEVTWNTAQYFVIPTGLLRAGQNEILLRLHPDGFGRPGLSSIYIGDTVPVRGMWEIRYFVQNTLPKFITAMVLLSGLVALWIWAKRHTEAMFGLYALMCLVSAVRTIHYFIRDYTSPFAHVAVPALGILTALQLSFALRFANDSSPRFERAVWIFVGASTVVLLATPGAWYGLATEYFNNALGVIGIAILWVLVRSLSRNFSIENLLMLFALVVNAALGIHDLANYLEYLGFDRLYLLPLGLPLFVAAVAALLVSRFVGTLNNYETLNAQLSDRVNEREIQLAASFEQVRRLDQQRATAEERQRLMRDMHDGIGSHLMSTLALARMGTLTAKQMSEALTDCIDELKITIDSLEPVESDLLVVLGNLRYRLGPRLNAAGIALEWAVKDLPPLEYLDAENVRSVLRIVQEAFTNTLKHANAKKITLSTSVDYTNNRVLVSVADDGMGLAESHANGRGIENMKSRAATLGGDLEIVQIQGGGTCLKLYLPVNQIEVQP